MKNYILFATAALMLAACSNDENLNNPNEPVELRLTSGLEVQTRGTALMSGEKVYAWVYDAGNGNPEYQAHELTAKVGGSFTCTPMYFPETGNGVDIYAMHGIFNPSFTPGSTFPGTDGVAFAVETDQSYQSGQGNLAAYTQSDLLYATKQNVARTKENVELTFYHMLSKIEIAIVSGDGKPKLAADKAVTITDVVTDGTFKPAKTDITEQTDRQAMITAGSAKSTMSVSQNISSSFEEANVKYNEAIIVPQDMMGKKIEFKLADGGTLSYTIPAFDGTPGKAVFESGKRYIYHITLKLTGLEVTAKIEDWGGGNTYTGNAEMQ